MEFNDGYRRQISRICEKGENPIHEQYVITSLIFSVFGRAPVGALLYLKAGGLQLFSVLTHHLFQHILLVLHKMVCAS